MDTVAVEGWKKELDMDKLVADRTFGVEDVSVVAIGARQIED